MESTFLQKWALLNAGYRALDGTRHPDRRSELLNGLWWLADILEEEIKAAKHMPARQHAVAEVGDFRDAVGDALKNSGLEINADKAYNALSKLFGDAPEWTEPDRAT